MPGGWSDDDDELDEGSRLDAENAVWQAKRVAELTHEALGDPARFHLTPGLIAS